MRLAFAFSLFSIALSTNKFHETYSVLNDHSPSCTAAKETTNSNPVLDQLFPFVSLFYSTPSTVCKAADTVSEMSKLLADGCEQVLQPGPWQQGGILNK